MRIRKIYIDCDGTIVNTTKRICDIYNEEFANHPDFKPARWQYVRSWDFVDECPLANKNIINCYFNRLDFYNEKLEYMENAKEIIYKLLSEFCVQIPTLGYEDNLYYKEKWLKKDFPSVKYIGCNLNIVKDKSHIDMSGGILIDDNVANLKTSNADIKICYGDIYEWNEDWEGKRCWNWYEVYNYVMQYR